MRIGALSGYGKFLSGLLAGVLLAGGVAYSASVNNTPEGGYLLCANLKTRAVTFPVKLSCPTGSKAIEVAGALSGGNSLAFDDTPDPIESPSSAPSKNSNAKCNIDYLLLPTSDIDAGIASCTSKEFNNLLQQVSAIDSNPNMTSDQKKRAISILTSLVSAIQKKVKA